MKSALPQALLIAAALLPGCATPPRGLVLDPVGPAPAPAVGDESTGSLIVFSAYEESAHFNASPYHHWLTDYKIYSIDRELLRTVHNDSNTVVEGPTRVKLTPGRYRVVARANGYGLVTVPVVIAAGEVTRVHLEGGGAWPDRALMLKSNPVCLPDGRIVGWRALPESLPKS